MVWVLKISPKNVKFFNFSLSDKKNHFGFGQKVPGSKAGWPLICCGSKVSLGLVGSGPASLSYLRASLGEKTLTILQPWSRITGSGISKKGNFKVDSNKSF